MHIQFHKNNQSGIASLIVTLVMMIVISLIVLGFAQISRREQTNALDRQLSTQAFYAAETGVNDALNAINTAGTAPITPKTSCGGDGGTTSIYYGKLNYTVNAAQQVTYTCLLVSTQNAALQRQIDQDAQWVVPIHPVDASGNDAPISQLSFSWPPETSTNSSATAASGCPTASGGHIQNPSTTNWGTCGYGAMRLDLVPVVASDDPTRQSLEQKDMVVFAYPSTSGAATYSYTAGLNGSNSSHQTLVTCNAGGVHTCVLTINNLPSSTAGNPASVVTYYARIQMLYRGTGTDVVQITSSSPSITFADAQVQVDATGKAQNVLRRIRVTVPVGTAAADASPYAINTRDSICKRYSVAPTLPPNYQNTAASQLDNKNDTCQ